MEDKSLEYRKAVSKRLNAIRPDLDALRHNYTAGFLPTVVESMQLSVDKVSMLVAEREFKEYVRCYKSVGDTMPDDQHEQLIKHTLHTDITEQRRKLIDTLLLEVEMLLEMDQQPYKDFIRNRDKGNV